MAGGGAALLIALLALLVGTSWRSADRLEPLDHHLVQFERLEQEFRLLMDRMINGKDVAAKRSLAESARLMRTLAEQGGHFSPDTDQRLHQVAGILSPGPGSHQNSPQGQPEGRLGDDERSRLMRALQLLGTTFREEVAAQRGMLKAVSRDNERELNTAIAVATILPMLAAGVWILFRRRVLQPLDDLSGAIGLLARKDFRTVDFAHIDPVIRPVFMQYNRMVGRMQDLELAHVKREVSLRHDLEQATAALLKQREVLARADRMAAAGNMVARMAHRLRSPLSGVVVTLTNLQSEIDTDSHRERLSKSVEALRRSFDELSALVAEVQQDPEPLTPLALRNLVDELFLLVRYQAGNRNLMLKNEVPADLVLDLPEAGARHALMSLLTNAIEAQRGVAEKSIQVAAEDQVERVSIAVIDKGPGFSDAELQREQNGTSAWNRPIAGLGLGIVRRFVDHLGGELVLENPEAGGARAVVIIPRETIGV